jgi:hypothetical protein
MNVLLVTMELNPGGNEEDVHNLLAGFDNMRLNDFAYLLATDLGPDDIYRKLQPLLGGDDIVYVITAAKPWMGYGYEAMNEWLNGHLG